ncbi:MAG: SPFH domain-containing protein [Enterocloster sp.]
MFGAIGGFITFIIIAVIILFVLSTCIRVVPQAQALVVERLGAYLGTYSVGIHFLVPFIDRVAKKVNLKEQVEDFPPQPVITKDNVTMQIDTVVSSSRSQIRSCTPTAWSARLLAIENLTATTLRNIIGDLELDETLTSRETINAKMQRVPG